MTGDTEVATPLEAYLTGVIHTGLSMYGLPEHMHTMAVTTESGEVTGVIELHTPDGQVRASIVVVEVRD